MERKELIEKIKELCPIENDKLDWGDLCYFTKFDSFATALAYGMNWNIDNVNEMPIAHLKVALYSLVNYPNLDDNNNSRKAGYGKSQQRIDFLKNYRDGRANC